MTTVQQKDMPARVKQWIISIALVSGAIALTTGAVAVFQPESVEAHCDSVNGPVVAAARQALVNGDVSLALPYVKPEAEAELAAAFQQAIEARKAGGMAAQIADRWFFETAVRLHRVGEGAPYTGLKDASDVGPALEAAERALESGSLAEVYAVLNQAVQDSVTQKYQLVASTREHAAQEGTVEADRERVEAELDFERYVAQVFETAQGPAIPGEGAGGHAHAAAPHGSAGN